MDYEVKDMLDTIYHKLTENEVIKKFTRFEAKSGHDGFRINYYLEPENADLSKPFIIISPIGPPKDEVYGSNKPLSTQFIYQIDVQSKVRKDCKVIQQAIAKELLSLNFFQQEYGFDEYFKETQRFVDARRYQGNSNLYDTSY